MSARPDLRPRDRSFVMSAVLVSLLRNIDTIEHIRAAVCAAKESQRELSTAKPDSLVKEIAAIAL
ncbi:hypothetical protein ACVJBD_002752 [Rhizobium mongolense]